jgi:hypothetical protein
VQQKSLALRVKAAEAADDAALAAIRAYTLRDFAADELQVREYVLAHNCIDRDNEIFDEGVLDDFARTLPGKGVYIKHPSSWQGDGGPAEGRVYATSTKTMSLDEARTLLREPDLQRPPDRSMVKLLRARAFFAKTPDNASLLIKQDAGIAGDVSIGFTAQSLQKVMDTQGNELTARRWMGPAKALEMSLVWLGAQPGARAVKGATHESPETPETPLEKVMDIKQEDFDALNAKAASGEKATTALAAIKTALGDDAALVENPAQLKAYVADAKAFKASLVDEVIALERQLKMTGDTPEDMAATKAFLGEFSVERLQTMQKGYEKRLPGSAAIKGAHTNAGGPGTQEAPADSPINNPALAA